MNDGFYVWNIQYGHPTHCHATLDSAVREAERLARVAQKMVFDGDPRIDDKWGDAGCIDLGDGWFLFFGWASS